MSEASMARFDLDAQIARIERMLAETGKLNAETLKLHSQGPKFERGRTTLILTAGVVIGGLLVRLLYDTSSLKT